MGWDVLTVWECETVSGKGDQRNELKTSIRVRDRIDPVVIADTIGEQLNMPPFGLVQGGDRWQ